ncbi:hypothetical protein CC78DRAFT_548745 [Lojkania enalia]|uniref:Uncharacterized protein n=1 Tax=Lojkania enalia TaxID=147567 RepID=A0A9P4K1C9_9PLEO|nr:hypothetical protein CC78DRAFT_548745 [Didymosphaeria enalia]
MSSVWLPSGQCESVEIDWDSPELWPILTPSSDRFARARYPALVQAPGQAPGQALGQVQTQFQLLGQAQIQIQSPAKVQAPDKAQVTPKGKGKAAAEAQAQEAYNNRKRLRSLAPSPPSDDEKDTSPTAPATKFGGNSQPGKAGRKNKKAKLEPMIQLRQAGKQFAKDPLKERRQARNKEAQEAIANKLVVEFLEKRFERSKSRGSRPRDWLFNQAAVVAQRDRVSRRGIVALAMEKLERVDRAARLNPSGVENRGRCKDIVEAGGAAETEPRINAEENNMIPNQLPNQRDTYKSLRTGSEAILLSSKPFAKARVCVEDTRV